MRYTIAQAHTFSAPRRRGVGMGGGVDRYSDKLINMFKPTELCLKPSCTYKNLRMGIVCRYFLHFCFVADPNPPGDEYELITGIRIRIRPLVSPEIFITRRKQIIIPELGSRHATMFRKRVNVFRPSMTLIS